MSKILSLQLLRGIAATLVVGFHLFGAVQAEGGNPGCLRFFAGGEIGVDIFFVISGFIIFYVASQRRDMTRSDFLKARFWRIIPPYWAILSLYILAAAMMAVLLNDPSKIPTVKSLFVSYFLLPYPEHVIVIAWTLSLELLFYMLFAFTFFKYGQAGLVVGVILWAGTAQIALHFLAEIPHWLKLSLHSAVLEFLFGIAIATYLLNRSDHPPKYYLIALTLGIFGVLAFLVTGGFYLGSFGREISAGIPAALLVYGVLGLRLQSWPFIEIWGDSSYILYLFHLLYFSIIGKAAELVFGINVYRSPLWTAGLFVSVIVICCIATVQIERPYQRWYKKFV